MLLLTQVLRMHTSTWLSIPHLAGRVAVQVDCGWPASAKFRSTSTARRPATSSPDSWRIATVQAFVLACVCTRDDDFSRVFRGESHVCT